MVYERATPFTEMVPERTPGGCAMPHFAELAAAGWLGATVVSAVEALYAGRSDSVLSQAAASRMIGANGALVMTSSCPAREQTSFQARIRLRRRSAVRSRGR